MGTEKEKVQAGESESQVDLGPVKELEEDEEGSDGEVQSSKVKMRLTPRDYEIFGFLLDQKFASLETLYFRFFDQRKTASEPLPTNLYVARQRLGILKRAGLLKTDRVYSEAKSLYLLSPLGFRLFSARRPEEAYAPPVKDVDFRNYEHDQAVNYCRVAIERGGKCLRWYSERQIRKQGFHVKDIDQELPSTVIPDGIFIDSKGERVAFEFEGAVRKRSRYAFKMQEYRQALHGRNPLIHKVLFVSSSQRVHSDLKEVMEGRDRFLLESYGHFLGRLFPRGEVLRVGKLRSARGED